MKYTANDIKIYRGMTSCPQCGTPAVKRVSVTLLIPAGYFELSKRALRDPDIKLEGADFPNAKVSCPKCPWKEG